MRDAKLQEDKNGIPEHISSFSYCVTEKEIEKFIQGLDTVTTVLKKLGGQAMGNSFHLP